MYQTGVGEPDPSKFTLSIWCGITSAALAAAGPNWIPIFEFGTSTDPLSLNSFGNIRVDGMEISLLYGATSSGGGYDVVLTGITNVDNPSFVLGGSPDYPGPGGITIASGHFGPNSPTMTTNSGTPMIDAFDNINPGATFTHIGGSLPAP